MGKSAAAFCFAAAIAFPAPRVFAQNFYAGVKGGVLLSSARETLTGSSRAGVSDTSMLLRRYSVGPSFELGLPKKLRLETGLLYRRFDATDTVQFAGVHIQTTFSRDNRWEVPLVIRREMRGGAARPFVGAGGVWSRFSRDARTEILSTLGGSPQFTTGEWHDSDDLFGWVGSAGVRFRLPFGLKLTPELRYTRWTAKRWLPSQNQVDFLLGIGF